MKGYQKNLFERRDEEERKQPELPAQSATPTATEPPTKTSRFEKQYHGQTIFDTGNGNKFYFWKNGKSMSKFYDTIDEALAAVDRFRQGEDEV